MKGQGLEDVVRWTSDAFQWRAMPKYSFDTWHADTGWAKLQETEGFTAWILDNCLAPATAVTQKQSLNAQIIHLSWPSDI